MKQRCRTCGEWFLEKEMFETNYQTYSDENEFICEGCYDNAYGKCAKCGEIIEAVSLVKKNDVWVCNTDYTGECAEH
jgi:formylmethanofuran dehydrogenase subunit E